MNKSSGLMGVDIRMQIIIIIFFTWDETLTFRSLFSFRSFVGNILKLNKRGCQCKNNASHLILVIML